MFCHQASKILGLVIVYNYGAGQKLSIISNRLATGVMTSPCFLPLVAFFQAAGFMTWEYLITDFNWHKPNTSTPISCWLLFVSTATFWLFRRQSLENRIIFTLNVLVEEVYLCFSPIVTLINGMSCGPAPATTAPGYSGPPVISSWRTKFLWTKLWIKKWAQWIFEDWKWFEQIDWGSNIILKFKPCHFTFLYSTESSLMMMMLCKSCFQSCNLIIQGQGLPGYLHQKSNSIMSGTVGI